MKNKRTWLLRLGIAVGLLGLAVIALAPLVPLARFQPQVEAELTRLTGREVTVEAIRLSLLGGPHVILHGLTIHQAPRFGDRPLLKTPEASVNLALLPLLQGRVVVEAVGLEQPEITLVRQARGDWNWLGLTPPAPPVAPVSIRPVRADQLFLTTRIAQAVTIELEAVRLTVSEATVLLIDGTGPAETNTTYEDIWLTATVSRGAAPGESGDPPHHVTGELWTAAEADHPAALKLQMPFALDVYRNPTSAVSLQGHVGPGWLEYERLSVQDLTASLQYGASRLNLTPASFNAYGGRAHGRVALDLAREEFDFDLNVEGLELGPLMSQLLAMPDLVQGRLTTRVALRGPLGDLRAALPRLHGNGQITEAELFVPALNVSEQVARALRVRELGDSAPGTSIAGLQGEFRLEQGVIQTSNMRLRQFDGLGAATVEQGSLSLTGLPTVNYTAEVVLADEVTAQLQQASLLYTAIAALLTRNNRLTVPLTVTGPITNPQVRVDIQRLF